MVVLQVRLEPELQLALKNNTVVIVDFSAEWCGPCRMIAPVFEQLSERYNKAHFIRVDMDTAPELSEKYEIRSLPTFVVFKDGEEVDRLLGADPRGVEEAVSMAVAGI